MNECLSVVRREQQPEETDQDSLKSSPFIRRRPRNLLSNSAEPPFEICPDINIYMYCTCAPCGDASMELCMAAQEDATPWAVKSESGDIPAADGLLDGRANFSVLGVVRRKPSRADAEATLSKSCSDKLALRQVTSLLSYPTSILIAPTKNAYLCGIVLPEEEISQTACDRAFSPRGRMQELVGRQWTMDQGVDVYAQYGYQFRPFQILSISTETVQSLWPYGKPRPDASSPSNSLGKSSNKTGNASAVWIASCSSQSPFQFCSSVGKRDKLQLGSSTTAVTETIINGVKQGNKAFSSTPLGASVLSRAKMWNTVLDVIESSEDLWDASAKCEWSWRRVVDDCETYENFKRPFQDQRNALSMPWSRVRMKAMEDTKRVLRPWIPNRGDEDWNRADVLAEAKAKGQRPQA